jgi:hypothetical protein
MEMQESTSDEVYSQVCLSVESGTQSEQQNNVRYISYILVH